MIKLKSPREIALMREAGRLVAEALAEVRRLAVPGATTADFDAAVDAIYRARGAIPLFKNYPNSVKGKPAVPRRHLCQHQRAGRPRHPQPPAPARGTSSRSIPAASSTAGAATPP